MITFLPFCSFSELPNSSYFAYQGVHYFKSEDVYGISLDGEPVRKSFFGNTVVLPFETEDYEIEVS